MNICLLGNNLTNLVLANILLKKKINVDIITQAKPSLLVKILKINLKYLNLKLTLKRKNNNIKIINIK